MRKEKAMRVVLVSVIVILGLLYCFGTVIVKSETEQREILNEIESLVEDMEQQTIILEERILSLQKRLDAIEGERENEGVEHQTTVGKHDNPGLETNREPEVGMQP